MKWFREQTFYHSFWTLSDYQVEGLQLRKLINKSHLKLIWCVERQMLNASFWQVNRATNWICSNRFVEIKFKSFYFYRFYETF